MGAEMVRIVIDEESCMGVGYCVKAEPEAVEFLDSGYATALPGVVLPRERAQELCDRCPSAAIRIVDGDRSAGM